MPQDCFRDSSIVIVRLSSAVRRIDEGAFANSRVAELHIPKEVTYISDTAASGVVNTKYWLWTLRHGSSQMHQYLSV